MKSRLLILLLLGGLTACQGRPQFQFGAYSEAERYFEKKEYAKALAQYEEYLRENREGNMAVIALYYSARSHEELGQAEAAQEIYERIAGEHPSLIWAEFSKSRLKEMDSRAPAR